MQTKQLSSKMKRYWSIACISPGKACRADIAASFYWMHTCMGACAQAAGPHEVRPEGSGAVWGKGYVLQDSQCWGKRCEERPCQHHAERRRSTGMKCCRCRGRGSPAAHGETMAEQGMCPEGAAAQGRAYDDAGERCEEKGAAEDLLWTDWKGVRNEGVKFSQGKKGEVAGKHFFVCLFL